MSASVQPLTKRWYALNHIPAYDPLFLGRARFKVVPAGRRSGKTENLKRFTFVGNEHHMGAMTYDLPFDDGWFVLAAPTHKQAKRIFWRDMKSLCPKWLLQKKIESELTLRLVNGVEITVMGMDAPDRLEGRALDGIGLDEYGNMKPEVWEENIRPALSTLGRPGWAWLIGVPEGRNHYYDRYRHARDSGDPMWSSHTWKSAEVIDPEELAQAKRDMDELTYLQEYEASFVNFEGRAYYSFGDHNLFEELIYDENAPLIFCFDFNTSPGVAAVVQEQTKTWYLEEHGIQVPENVDERFTAVIGQVWIPRHSNTPRVCAKLADDWGHHSREILIYGDATGGAKGTQSVEGSDWELIEQALDNSFDQGCTNMVERANPRERVRVNAMNSRCKTADGTIKMLVHPEHANRMVDDLEGVVTLEGTNGELDKDSDKTLTHISDALGYYVASEHPIDAESKVTVIPM